MRLFVVIFERFQVDFDDDLFLIFDLFPAASGPIGILHYPLREGGADHSRARAARRHAGK